MDRFYGWLTDVHWGAVLTLVVGSSLVTTVLTHVLSGRSNAAQSRRRAYADALAALVAWYEFPYRVKRRTSDEPAVLSGLVDRGHDLQERLAATQMWVRSESAWVGEVFTQVRQRLDREVGPLCKDAWAAPPVTTAADMALGNWGPPPMDTLIGCFERAVSWRFGCRRLVPSFVARRIGKIGGEHV